MTHLKAEPADKLFFNNGTAGGDTVILKLTNKASKNVAYKIKGTAPKSYNIRPKEGVLKPGVSQDVMIVLVKAGVDGAHNQKFQIKAMQTASITVTKEQWEDGEDGGEIQEHRLSAFLGREQETPVIDKAFVSSEGLGELPPSIPEHPRQSPMQAEHASHVPFTTPLEVAKAKAENEKNFSESAACTDTVRIIAGLTMLTVLLSFFAHRRSGTSS